VNKLVVLCIDDEGPGLLVRSSILQLHGYTVLTARTGREGLDVFASQAVDAVLLDFCMPDLNGQEVASHMKTTKPNVPVILLTAYVSVPDSTARLVDRVVLKAQHPSVLLGILSECTQKGDTLSEKAS
jgi:CheY-like chemotaxis protein